MVQTAEPTTESPRRRRRRSWAPVRTIQHTWDRVSDGLQAQQLWEQFRRDAHAGYQHYTNEVDWAPRENERGIARGFRIAREMFWAVLGKLSPARRVLLLLSIAVTALGAVELDVNGVAFSLDLRGVGFVLLLMLLGLELADRVTMKRDLEIAREIQHWLVPESPPRAPGLDIAFTTKPANTVAGDYYDAFFRDPGERKLVIAIADVAGKSVPAALLMATFQAGLHSCAHDLDSPLHVAERLNHLACSRSLEGRRFTTAFLGDLDLDRMTLDYVNAGHNAPVLRHAAGTWERLDRGGLPFGVHPDARYEVGSAALDPGDLLFLFTDGLVEARNPSGVEYGDERIVQVLGGLRDADAASTIGSILAELDRFVAGAHQHDDITCLAVRTGPASTLPPR
jgi:sigma-B regulation protein RsbU (phosphoserine phosphatase)